MSGVITCTRVGLLVRADAWYPWMDDVLSAKLYDAGAVWEDKNGEKHRGLSYHKELFRRDGNAVLFPFGLCKKFEKKAKEHGMSVSFSDARKAPKLTLDSSVLDAEYRFKQKEALNLLLTADHGIVLCATGYGKSWLIKKLVQAQPTAQFVVVTPRSEVVRELYNGLVELIGKDQVGKLCGGTPKTEERKRVVVSTASSMKRARLEDCDYLLFDEVHGVGPGRTAETLLARVGHARMFGFTASLHRGDGGVAIIKALFGEPILEVSFQEAVDQKMIVPIKLYMPEFNGSYHPRVTGILAIDERCHYWRNRERNELIADMASNLPDSAQCLITVKTLEHAIYLHTISALSDYTVIHYGKTIPPKKRRTPWTPETVEQLYLHPDKYETWFNPDKNAFKVLDQDNRPHILYLVRLSDRCVFHIDNVVGKEISAESAFKRYSRYDDGEAFGAVVEIPVTINGVSVDKYAMTSKQRAALIQAFADRDIKKVISTYTLREGVNIANLEYLIRADGATSNVVNTQFPGRACRLAEGKKQAVLIDLFDTFTPWAKERSITRLKQYKAKGWTV